MTDLNRLLLFAAVVYVATRPRPGGIVPVDADAPRYQLAGIAGFGCPPGLGCQDCAPTPASTIPGTPFTKGISARASGITGGSNPFGGGGLPFTAA